MMSKLYQPHLSEAFRGVYYVLCINIIFSVSVCAYVYMSVRPRSTENVDEFYDHLERSSNNNH